MQEHLSPRRADDQRKPLKEQDVLYRGLAVGQVVLDLVAGSTQDEL